MRSKEDSDLVHEPRFENVDLIKNKWKSTEGQYECKWKHFDTVPLLKTDTLKTFRRHSADDDLMQKKCKSFIPKQDFVRVVLVKMEREREREKEIVTMTVKEWNEFIENESENAFCVEKNVKKIGKTGQLEWKANSFTIPKEQQSKLCSVSEMENKLKWSFEKTNKNKTKKSRRRKND